MFIDASALTALLTKEQEARELLARLQQVRTRLTSFLAFWEATIEVSRHLDLSITTAAEALESYLGIMEIELVAVPAGAARIALEAFDRYGKGGPSRTSQLWRLLRLCVRPLFRRAVDVQGRRLRSNRYRSSLREAFVPPAYGFRMIGCVTGMVSTGLSQR